MKPPKLVKIVPIDYKIMFASNLSGDKGESLWGHCDHTGLTIRIDDAVDPAFVKIIVLHEILHALHNLSGLPDPASEEQTITSLSPVLLLLMKDNPKLMEYLCER